VEDHKAVMFAEQLYLVSPSPKPFETSSVLRVHIC